MSLITFASIPLLQNDHEGKFQRFLDHHQNLGHSPIYGDDSISRTSSRNITRADLASGVGLPLPNYSPEPKPRINVLRWPSGAARFSTFFGVCDSVSLADILDATGNGNQPKTLVVGTTAAENMYLLPPRAITGTEDTYLLPIVDRRYFWQDKNTGAIELDENSTWADVFSAIETAIGVAINAHDIHADYLAPDWRELERQYQSVGVFFDAVASSVGQRVFVGLDSTVWSVGPTGNPLLQSAGWEILAGGNNSGNNYDLPENIVVTFPKMAHHAAYCNGSKYAKSVAVGGGTKTTGTTKTIHSSCYADYTAGSANPDNKATIDNLAARIVNDWALWRVYKYDVTFDCVRAWQPTGWDDFVEYSLGEQRPDGMRLAQTRACSPPNNFGFEQQLSQDSSLIVLDKHQVGRTNGTIDGGGSGTINVYDASDNFITTISASDWWVSQDQYANGTKVLLWWNCESNEWVFAAPSIPGEAWFIEFELASTKEPFDATSANAVVVAYWGKDENPGATVTLYDQLLTGSVYVHRGCDGDHGTAVYDEDREQWEIVSLRPTVPREFLATLAGTLQHDDTTADVSLVRALDGGCLPSVSLASNYYHFAGAFGDDILVKEDLYNTSYFVAQIEHVEKTVVGDVFWDGDKLEYREAKFMAAGDNGDGDINTIVTADTVDVVYAVDWSDPNLTKTIRTIKVFDDGSDGTPSTILTADSVDVVYAVDWSDPDLTKTIRTIKVFDDGSTGTPSTILTADSVEVVYDVDWDDPDLEQSKRTIKVFDDGSAGSPSSILTGSECSE